MQMLQLRVGCTFMGRARTFMGRACTFMGTGSYFHGTSSYLHGTGAGAISNELRTCSSDSDELEA